MSEPTYQEINSINITSNALFTSGNTQLDTTGRIDEKLAANKYNYTVDTLTTDESSATADIIFVEIAGTPPTYALKRKSGSSYVVYDVPISSIVLITDANLQDTYTLYETNTSSTPHTQTWYKTDIFNDAKQMHLTYTTGDTLITDGNIQINGTPSDNKHAATKGYVDNTVSGYVLKSSASAQTISGEINMSNSNNTITAATVTAPTITTSGTGANITVSGTNSYIQTPILKLPINTSS